MGKNKGTKGSSVSTAATATAKCTCDHPFECKCGNRPPRPSRGHKWDTESQTWGGKGHKQKGASGQSSAAATRGVVTIEATSIGKTRIEGWQRLPSMILEEYCVKQKRPRPNYKNISQKPSEFKYRVILPDPKGDDAKDLIFKSPVAVANEEQSKEEASLLVLLQLTPTIPHERTLPDPYKATWLHAIASLKQNKSSKAPETKDKKTSSAPTCAAPGSSITALGANDTTSSSNDNNGGGGGDGAKASTHLALALQSQGNTRGGGTTIAIGTSRAQQQQAAMERRRLRNAKIQHFEALHWANRNHIVSMSAMLRKRIESLLRGDYNAATSSSTDDEEEDDQDEGGDDDDDISLVQACVNNHLHQLGFTRRQARVAFQQQTKNKSRADLDAIQQDDDMDDWCEKCLKWLMVHVNEEDLPAGLDPTEGTLDVIVSLPKPSTKSTTNTSTTTTADADAPTSSNSNNNIPMMVTDFAARHALSLQNATVIYNDALDENGNNITEDTLQDCFWKRIVAMANVSLVGTGDEEQDTEEATSLLRDECEALEAIFPDECTIQKDSDNNGITTITLVAHVEDAGRVAVLFAKNVDTLRLQVVVENGKYPTSKWPRRVLLSSSSSSEPYSKAVGGVALHVEMARFVASSPLGEPMIYEIHSHVNTLLKNVVMAAAENPMSLQQSLFTSSSPPAVAEQKEQPVTTSNDKKIAASSRSSSSIKKNANKTRASQPNQRQRRHRPREKSSFWSKTAQNTPAAVAFPSNIAASLKRARQSLPAATARGEFLRALEKANRGGHVLLCTGDTGCGKTTQIPQFILEEYPKDAKIVVCQPRRLAATGVAARVAEERGESQPGRQSVGYVVRGDAALCEQSRLVFCTTGVLLRQLQSDGALDCLTHIVVDEVHERNLDTDILLALLKQTLPNVPHIRVILMSATLDADRFAAYWGKDTPRIHIPGRTFPVQDYMLEDVLSITGFIPPRKGKGKGRNGSGSQNRPRKATSWADSEASDVEPEDEEEEQEEETAENAESKDGGDGGSVHGIPIEDLVDRIDETNVDYDLLARLVKHLIVNKDPTDDGSVLVFLPGAPEINKAIDTIKRVTKELPTLRLLPLHGGLQPKDQNLVFRPVGASLHKVILSTNVAETSVTIPDCTVVIDSAREKQSSYDPSNRMPLLVEKFCSKASLEQRRGRAGRVREGTCYKLISRRTYSTLSEHGEPEIQRCALDQTILSLLFLGMDCNPTPGGFLDRLLDPPSKKSVKAAIFSLEKLGAVIFDKQSNNVSLTPLGMHLAGIPAAPIVGKILVMGSMLGCRNAGVAMAASLSMGRNPLLRIDTPRTGGRKDSDEPASIEEMKHQNIRTERAQLFDKIGRSDHAFLAALFLNWKECEGKGRKIYCDSLGLSFLGMREMLQLANQLDNALQSIGYLDTPDSNRSGRLWSIIRAVAVAGMAPGQLVKVVRPATIYLKTAEGAKEKDGEAREIKFFVRTDGPDDENNAATSAASRGNYGGGRFSNEERVFVHPSSANFSTGSFSCPWLVYHSLVRTSKAFLRDVTECNAYTLLLFGGKLDVVAFEGVVILNHWCKLGANARIGSLMEGLRVKVDDLLAKKVLDPTFDIAATEEMKLIVQLIATDGVGTFKALERTSLSTSAVTVLQSHGTSS